jgi:hypothetical protein
VTRIIKFLTSSGTALSAHSPEMGDGPRETAPDIFAQDCGARGLGLKTDPARFYTRRKRSRQTHPIGQRPHCAGVGARVSGDLT